MHMIYIAIPLVYDGNLLTPQMARAIGRAWESYWGSYFKCRKRYLCALWSLGVGAAAGRGCEMFMTAWVLVPLQGAAAGCVRLCVCVCLSVCVCVPTPVSKELVDTCAEQGAIPLTSGGWPPKRPLVRAANVPADLIRATGGHGTRRTCVSVPFLLLFLF